MSAVGRPRLLDAIEATTFEGGEDTIVRALKVYEKKNRNDPKLPDMMGQPPTTEKDRGLGRKSFTSTNSQVNRD